jgi:type VI secretion system secreted protein Hcp
VVHVVDNCTDTGDLQETVNLSYGDIEFEYKTQDAKGALAGSTKFGWDLTSTKTR